MSGVFWVLSKIMEDKVAASRGWLFGDPHV